MLRKQIVSKMLHVDW